MLYFHFSYTYWYCVIEEELSVVLISASFHHSPALVLYVVMVNSWNRV